MSEEVEALKVFSVICLGAGMIIGAFIGWWCGFMYTELKRNKDDKQ